MSENVVLENQQEQDNLYFSEYVEGISQLHRGSTVRGAVIRYDNEYVYVDVHDKSEGRIPVHEFNSDPDFDLANAAANHTEVDVFVRSIKNTDQGKEIILSKAQTDFGKFKDLAEAAFNEKLPVTVKVVNVVKDGIKFKKGTILDDAYINSLKTVKEREAAHSLNRRTEFKVLRTNYVPAAGGNTAAPIIELIDDTTPPATQPEKKTE